MVIKPPTSEGSQSTILLIINQSMISQSYAALLEEIKSNSKDKASKEPKYLNVVNTTPTELNQL